MKKRRSKRKEKVEKDKRMWTRKRERRLGIEKVYCTVRRT